LYEAARCAARSWLGFAAVPVTVALIAVEPAAAATATAVTSQDLRGFIVHPSS
jgi:hypothetical protein